MSAGPPTAGFRTPACGAAGRTRRLARCRRRRSLPKGTAVRRPASTVSPVRRRSYAWAYSFWGWVESRAGRGRSRRRGVARAGTCRAARPDPHLRNVGNAFRLTEECFDPASRLCAGDRIGAHHHIHGIARLCREPLLQQTPACCESEPGKDRPAAGSPPNASDSPMTRPSPGPRRGAPFLSCRREAQQWGHGDRRAGSRRSWRPPWASVGGFTDVIVAPTTLPRPPSADGNHYAVLRRRLVCLTALLVVAGRASCRSLLSRA